jgi:hypothetical protein
MYHFATLVPQPWLKIFVNNEGNVLKSALGRCKTFFTVTYQPENKSKKKPRNRSFHFILFNLHLDHPAKTISRFTRPDLGELLQY